MVVILPGEKNNWGAGGGGGERVWENTSGHARAGKQRYFDLEMERSKQEKEEICSHMVITVKGL